MGTPGRSQSRKRNRREIEDLNTQSWLQLLSRGIAHFIERSVKCNSEFTGKKSLSLVTPFIGLTFELERFSLSVSQLYNGYIVFCKAFNAPLHNNVAYAYLHIE